MSQKLIEFLVQFSDFSYNIIAYFLCRNMYYLPNFYFAEFMAEMKIPAKISSESSSMAKVRSRQRIKVATISPTIMNEKQLQQKRSC